mmetsp:Transcript_51549/g.51953  ORF Transcript_51549/g.51953 Transcript_51549/m.51953 type:complete len:83 (-) Transcript_51549:169-417(-)
MKILCSPSFFVTRYIETITTVIRGVFALRLPAVFVVVVASSTIADAADAYDGPLACSTLCVLLEWQKEKWVQFGSNWGKINP